jgi:hypothetical protein
MSIDTSSDDTARKEAFDRDKVCYEQTFQQYRAMNQSCGRCPC